MRTARGAPVRPHRFSTTRRLTRPAEFARVLAAPAAEALRAHGRLLAMKALRRDAPARGVRLGLTVGKRFARRAVDRALVKRLVREAFRAAAPRLEAAAVAVDISVRLAAPLPAAADGGLTALKRALRGEAERLFARLEAELAAQGDARPA